MLLLLGIPHDLDGVPGLRGDTDAPDYNRVKAPVRWVATSVTGAVRCIGTTSASTLPHMSSAHGRYRAGWVATNHALSSHHSRAYQKGRRVGEAQLTVQPTRCRWSRKGSTPHSRGMFAMIAEVAT